MDLDRLGRILETYRSVRIAVLGDFFLDQYWAVNTDRTETSIETGLPAYQVEEIRLSPGAAGTVVNNLAALGAGEIRVVGFVGDDGNGFELERRLARQGVLTDGLLSTPLRNTPVYTKPMFRASGVTRQNEVEGSRFDIKNRTTTPAEVEGRLVAALMAALGASDVVVTLDQVQEPDCGVVTGQLREELARIARTFPAKFFLADSRTRIGLFRHVMIKANRGEARAAVPGAADDHEAAAGLWRGSQAPVFMTRGEEGILVFDGNAFSSVRAPKLQGPLDPVGAGDSCSAAIALALAAGASLVEAAQLGVLAASITIRKIGTTGTASAEEMLDLARSLPPQPK